jgi:hypothetical protein
MQPAVFPPPSHVPDSIIGGSFVIRIFELRIDLI